MPSFSSPMSVLLLPSISAVGELRHLLSLYVFMFQWRSSQLPCNYLFRNSSTTTKITFWDFETCKWRELLIPKSSKSSLQWAQCLERKHGACNWRSCSSPGYLWNIICWTNTPVLKIMIRRIRHDVTCLHVRSWHKYY